MSKSLFGSVKDKLSRKSSTNSDKTTTSTTRSPYNMGQQRNPFSSPAPAANIIDEAPPAYTPAAPSSALSLQYPGSLGSRGVSPAPSLASVTTDDDKYAFLATFDTVFVVDDSGSMSGSLWADVETALRAITPICTSHDRDGIDLYFLNHRSDRRVPAGNAPGGYYNITSPHAVENIFRNVRPRSTTPTGTRLEQILKPYVASIARAREIESVKPVNIIVITDGVPTDDPEGVIVQYAKKLDQLDAPSYQVGIQFFQVGNDPTAKEALGELDDELASQGVRDMVDTVTWDGRARTTTLTADGILKVVLGAVVRRLDRKATTNHQRSRT